jgi:hypothetical protein
MLYLPCFSRRLVVGALLGLAACGDNLGAAAVDGPAPSDGAPVDATVDAPALVCDEYPVPVPPGGSGEAAARAELATLSPTGQLTWSEPRGTLSTIFQLDVPLPACTDGADANAVVREVLSAHPVLFQLDFSEWRLPEPFGCQFVDDFSTITMGRRLLGGQPVARDIFSYTLRRSNGMVRLASTIATYLPPLPTEVAAAMASCNHLDANAAETTVRATTLHASTFAQCAPTGELDYQPAANDSYVLRDDLAWLWEETRSGATLSGMRTLRVTIDPSNYTPELLASDAKCPVLDGPGDEFTVGFDVLLDIETGVLLNVKPGLDCVVC